MSLKDILAKIEAEAKNLAHLNFLKAAARQAISNGVDAAFAKFATSAGEAVVIADVNGFIEHAVANFGPEFELLAGFGEVGVDKLIDAAFRHYGTAASAAQLKDYVFTHLGLK